VFQIPIETTETNRCVSKQTEKNRKKTETRNLGMAALKKLHEKKVISKLSPYNRKLF
jgi:hypothetical protein